MQQPRVHDYDLGTYDFPAVVAAALAVPDLQQVHRGIDVPRLVRETDQATPVHAAFYRTFDRVEPLYRRFVADVVRAVVPERFCFQRVPTLRVHLPGNVAVGEFHRDSQYSHPDGEVNFWLPLTPAWGSNSVWLEAPGEPARPVALRPGQVLVFDAVNTRHGNVVNETGVTRVSFDFRVLPLSRYRPTRARTVNTGLRLVIGEYFSLLDGDAAPAAGEPG